MQYRKGHARGKKCWQSEIQGCGMRWTVPREIIFDILKDSTEHLSAEDIFNQVSQKKPKIGLTTIYRTLELMARMNLVQKFDFGDGRARFELTDAYSKKEHHHHLICKKCNKIIDYFDFIDEEIELINLLSSKLSQKYNFKIEDHTLQFYGLCDKCKSTS